MGGEDVGSEKGSSFEVCWCRAYFDPCMDSRNQHHHLILDYIGVLLWTGGDEGGGERRTGGVEGVLLRKATQCDDEQA